MTAADYAEQLKELDATLRNIEAVLDLDKLREQKARLEQEASAPDLWDDQAKAQQVTSQLSYVNGEISKLGSSAPASTTPGCCWSWPRPSPTPAP